MNEYNISISVNPHEPATRPEYTPPASSYEGQPPAPTTYNPHPANYNAYGPSPARPFPFAAPNYGPPGGYPSRERGSYDHRHGVDRNNQRQGPPQRYENANRQRGGRGRGGINKNQKPRRNSRRNTNAGSGDESDDSRASSRN